MIKRLFVASAVLLCGHAAHVIAAPKSVTQYTYYKIAGTDAATVMRALNNARLSVGGHGAYAMTDFRRSTNPQFQQSGTKCRLISTGQFLKFTIWLPKLASPSKLKGKTIQAWNSFSTFARRHEETHRRIWEGCARDHEDAVASLSSSTCAEVQAKSEKLWQKAHASCMKKHTTFDAAQRHPLSNQALVRMAAN